MPHRQRDYSRFTEQFDSLVQGETNVAVAKRLGCRSPYVGHLKSGRTRPSAEMVLRICDEYGLSVREWMDYAGYNDDPLSNLVVSHEPPAGYRALERFAQGMHFLGLSLPVYAMPSEFPDAYAPPEEVDARLKAIADRALSERDRTKGHKSGARLAIA